MSFTRHSAEGDRRVFVNRIDVPTLFLQALRALV